MGLQENRRYDAETASAPLSRNRGDLHRTDRCFVPGPIACYNVLHRGHGSLADLLHCVVRNSAGEHGLGVGSRGKGAPGCDDRATRLTSPSGTGRVQCHLRPRQGCLRCLPLRYGQGKSEILGCAKSRSEGWRRGALLNGSNPLLLRVERQARLRDCALLGMREGMITKDWKSRREGRAPGVSTAKVASSRRRLRHLLDMIESPAGPSSPTQPPRSSIPSEPVACNRQWTREDSIDRACPRGRVRPKSWARMERTSPARRSVPASARPYPRRGTD